MIHSDTAIYIALDDSFRSFSGRFIHEGATSPSAILSEKYCNLTGFYKQIHKEQYIPIPGFGPCN